MPPPALAASQSAPAGSSRVDRVTPYFVQHKRDQVQAFDDSIQPEPLPSEEFLDCLGFNNNNNSVLPSEVPRSFRGVSIGSFLKSANTIAKHIKTKCEYHLFAYLSFLDNT